MADHPYQTLPAYCFWRRSIGTVAAPDVDPVVRASFHVTSSDRVATAGSCFAQHLARHLALNGFNYYVAETVHPLIAHLAQEYNYGVFSARYGNIYTSRQFLQTVRRAYGLFSPRDSAWEAPNGRWIDPYIPQIQPRGFASLPELEADRHQHLMSVRTMIEQMDVLVFTLGLTETWVSRIDGAAYPLCPGVAGGRFDESQHAFLNLGVDDVIADMSEAITLLRTRNQHARIILTVSPVPLIATMEDRSILVSTTYSKSVLRVAAEVISTRFKRVAYFPSYEVITGNHARGDYYADDLREVTEAGVAHVMRLFMKHYAQADSGTPAVSTAPSEDDTRSFRAEQAERRLAGAAAVICDEVALDPTGPSTPHGQAEDPVSAHLVTSPVPRQTAPQHLLTMMPQRDQQLGGPESVSGNSLQQSVTSETTISAMDYLRGAAAEFPLHNPVPESPKPHDILRWLRRR